jgi:hypothetical protein
MGDEELAAIGTWTCICHRQDTWFVVTQFAGAFVFETIAWATHAAAIWATALNHEISDYAVEIQTVVVAVLNQVDETGASDWCLICKQIDVDGAFAGLHNGFELAHGVLS